MPTVVGGNLKVLSKQKQIKKIIKNPENHMNVEIYDLALTPALYPTVLANEFFPKFTSKIISVTPLVGVILTTLLCASPVSLQNIQPVLNVALTASITVV